MPKGIKDCPDCGRSCGAKTKFCPGCKYEFVAKSKQKSEEEVKVEVDPNAPKKRGRPKGSKNKSKTDVVQESTVIETGDLYTIKEKKPQKRAAKPPLKIVVNHLNESDGQWFFDLFNKFKKELNSDPVKVWDDYIKHKDSKDYIVGVRPYGFCHFRYLADGRKEIRELAVYPEWQKKGIARKLLEDVGKPAIVACYKDIEGLYMKCGFTWFGDVVDDEGNRMEVYRWD